MKRLLPLLFLLLCFPFLSATSPPYLKKEISVRIDDEELSGKEVRIDIFHDLRAKRAGGYAALYQSLLQKYEPKEALNYLGIGLGDYLSAECERYRVDPLDATLDWTKKISSPFLYYEERKGRAVDLRELGVLVARALDKDSGGCVRAHTHEVPAKISKADLVANTQEIARFSTDFSSSGENRRHNIALAAALVSGCVLMPDETFSFNEVVGVRSAERGFREANVVVNGEFVKGVGGGVCQVSTTLYNAVLLAALPVENAAAHSRPVSYVPYSRDCTVSSAIDFRFRNGTAHPLYIAAKIKGSRLTFVLYGEKRGGKTKLESELVERIPYRLRFADGSLVTDKESAVLVDKGREGVRSRLYRVDEKGRTLIRENVYPAKDEVYEKRPREASVFDQAFLKSDLLL